MAKQKRKLRHACRAARRLGLLLPSGVLAARGARGARRGARVHGPRPRGPGRGGRCAALLQGRPGGRGPPDRRGRAEPGGRGGPPAPRRDAAGLPQPLPADHADEGRRAEGGGAARRRRTGGTGRGPLRPAGGGDAGGTGREPAAGHRPPGADRGGLRAGPRLPRRAAAPPTGAGGREPGAPRPGRRAGAPRGRHGRRPPRHVEGPRAPRRAHLRPREADARHRRAPPGGERGATPQEAEGDGRALRRPARPPPQRRGARGAAAVHARRPGLPLPRLPRAGGGDAALLPPPGDGGGGAPALPPVPREGPEAGGAGARPHREAEPGRLLPHRLGPRELLPAGGHPRPGPGLGREQRGLLQPRHHRGRPGGDGAPLRALPLRGARGVAGHRPRPPERGPPRAGHPARLRALRGGGGGHDRERHHLPGPQRLAGDRQGAGHRGGRGRPAGEAHAELRVRGPRRHAGEAARAGGARPRRPADRALRPALRGDPGPAPAPRPALGGDGDRPGPARRGGAPRAREHAGPRDRPVGQGGLRRPAGSSRWTFSASA